MQEYRLGKKHKPIPEERCNGYRAFAREAGSVNPEKSIILPILRYK